VSELELRAWLVVLVSVLIAVQLAEAGIGSWEQQGAVAVFAVVGIAVATVFLSLRVLPWWAAVPCVALLGAALLFEPEAQGAVGYRRRDPATERVGSVPVGESSKFGSRSMTVPLAVAAVAITALVCATVLTMAGHTSMAVAMVVLAFMGVLMVGSEGEGQKKNSGFQP